MVYRLPATLALSAVAALTAAPSAQSALVEFTYSGVIVLVDGTPDAPFGSVVTNDTWQLVLVVDTNAAASATPGFFAGAVGSHYDGVIQAGFQVGAVDFPLGALPVGFTGSTFVSDDVMGDDIFASFVHVDGAVQIGVALYDAQLTALSSEAIPTALSPDWDPDQSALYINFGATLGGGTGLILGVITESSSRIIPTPGTITLLGLAGLTLMRRRR